MKTIDYTIDCTTEYAISEYLSHYYNCENLLFFDIETTGFLAKNATLYLIGVLWQEKDKIYIRQWFNNDGSSEKEMLLAFFSFCKHYTHLVHFNGLRFDLPYLRQKSDMLSVSFHLEETMSQIDIYKEIRPFKNILALDNMKQVSIEQYLKLARKDTYNGKKLIKLYQKYVAKPDSHLEQLLLLHNHDDLLGMTQVSHILHYKHFFEDLSIETIHCSRKEKQLLIQFTFSSQVSLPRRLSVTRNGIYLNAIHTTGTLCVPILHGTLKHYFDDYKNYYYLPLEDTAIHKSVAAYVDTSHKVKATKDTCYTQKTDLFIPCCQKEYAEIFYADISDHNPKQTLTSLLHASFEEQCIYIKNTLQAFL